MKFSYQKFIFYFLWVIALAVIQTTMLRPIQIFGVQPNLFVIFVVCAAILSSSAPESAIMGFVLGFLFDFLIGRTPGVSMLLLMYAGVLNGMLYKRILTGKYFGIITTVFVTSLLYSFLYYSMHFAMWGMGNFGYAFLRVMLVETVYNTIIAIPMFLLMRKGYRHV